MASIAMGGADGIGAWSSSAAARLSTVTATNARNSDVAEKVHNARYYLETSTIDIHEMTKKT